MRALRCPVLAIQGADDEYGTLAQVEGIRAARAATPRFSCSTAAATRRTATSPTPLARAVTDFISRHELALIIHQEECQ